MGLLRERALQILLAAPLEVEYIEVASSVDLLPLEPGRLLSEIATPRVFVAARAGQNEAY